MRHSICINYSDIILSPLNSESTEEYRKLRNKDENRKWFYYNSFISRKEQKTWYDNYLKNTNDYMWGVYFKGLFVGGVAIYDIRHTKNYSIAEFGRLLIDKDACLSNGGLKACIAACYLAFSVLEINDLILSVYSTNNRAIQIYKNVGFDLSDEQEVGNEIINMKLTKDDFIKRFGENNIEFQIKS